MTDPRGTLRLSTLAEEMDVDAVHAYLAGESYWARGIPRAVVARAIQHSLCVGVFDGAAQVAFAPAELAAILQSLPRTRGYEDLPSLIRRRG